MKKTMIAAVVSALTLSAFAGTSTPAGFTDDFDAALATSKKSGKTVYAVFSGSDWCYWCKVLEKDYLSKKEFTDEASKHFELVYIDSPRDKSKLSPKAAERNPGLTRKYGIRGFPSVKFISADGKASDASRPGKGVTPKAYAESLAKEVKLRPLIDKHVTPLADELDETLNPLFSELRKIGNPFRGEDEGKQRAAYKKSTAVLKKVLNKMKTMRAKIAKAKVPGEISYEKDRLLRRLDSNIKHIGRASEMSFDEAKKAYAPKAK